VALRSVRDRVVHGLNPLPFVGSTEKGFVVRPNESPFDEFAEWTEAHKYNEAAVSLLPWLSHVILGTVNACSELMAVFATEIELPPELTPGYRLFIRSENSTTAQYLLDALHGTAIWWVAENGDETAG